MSTTPARSRTSRRTHRTLLKPGKLKGTDLARGPADPHLSAVYTPGACGVSIPATRGTEVPLGEIQAPYGDSTEMVFSESVRKRRFRRRFAQDVIIARTAVAKVSEGIHQSMNILLRELSGDRELPIRGRVPMCRPSA